MLRIHRSRRGTAATLFTAGLAALADHADASLTIDLRLPDGDKCVVAQPGQRVLVDIWAVVDGASTDLTNSYGIQFVAGSIVSDGDLRINIAGGKGDLDMYRKTPQQTTALRPFARAGEQPGTQRDLDGDGDIDLGSPNQNDATGFIIMRSDPMEYLGLSGAVRPGPDGSSVEVKIGRVEALVVGNSGVATTYWVPRRNANGQISPEAGLWFDDDGGGPSIKTGATGIILTGEPLLFALCPEPGAVGLVACAGVGLLRRWRGA